MMTRSGWVWVALVAISVTCGAGCGAPLFHTGSPKAEPGKYFGPAPVESWFFAHDAHRTTLVDAPPNRPWRQLRDVTSEATSEAQAIGELKAKAAGAGADMLLRVSSGAGAQVTKQSGGDFSVAVRGVQIGGSTEATETSTRHHALGTAIRLAEPGREAYLGVECDTYTPHGLAWFAHAPDRLLAGLTAYVSGVDGPAAAAGVQPGELILGWQTSKGHASGPCRMLNAYLQEAGPGATIVLWLWRPGERSERLVRFSKGKDKPSTLTIRGIPEYGIQAVAVRNARGESPDALQAGDFILGYRDGAELARAVNQSGDELPLRVRREGSARMLQVRLGAIPDSWYRVGNEPYVRPDGAAPPRGDAPPTAGPGGVGLQLKADQYARLVVARTLPGHPAERAGVRAGDVIIAIDGEPAAGMKVDGAVARLRGEVGTAVVVEVQRTGVAEPLRFELRRATLGAAP
jgi:hypothetical protein